MPSDEVMGKLLESKRRSAEVCDAFARLRADGELCESEVARLVKEFVLAKFRLNADEASEAGDNLEKLAQASIAKMLAIAPEIVNREDKPANCDGADSATVKQALMIMALRREFEVDFDCFEAGLCKTTGELSDLVARSIGAA